MNEKTTSRFTLSFGERAKLFRKGKLVGLVNQEFHYPEDRKVDAFWDKLEIEQVGSRKI